MTRLDIGFSPSRQAPGDNVERNKLAGRYNGGMSRRRDVMLWALAIIPVVIVIAIGIFAWLANYY